MKVAHKQLITYSWLMLFIIFTVITVRLEQSMADKVFSSYDSQVVHKKECKELDLSKDLVEFPSAQQAIEDGALPCKFCMGQYASHSGDQQFKVKKQNNSSVTGSTARMYTPQPIVVRELSTLYGAVKVDSLYMFAEDYSSHSEFDFYNANLRAVQVTLQNTSHDKDAHMYQFHYTDFHGIGNEEYMPYPYQDAIMLMENSIKFAESIRGAKAGVLRGAAIGAVLGAVPGLISGDPMYAAYGAANEGVFGCIIGGFTGYCSYKEEATLAVNDEVQSRIMPDDITVEPDGKITGVLFFPVDTHTIRINIEGIDYDFAIH